MKEVKVGIVGLGLIGGSMAKAYKRAGAQVAGFDINDLITQFAQMAEAIDETLTDENINECDCILIAIPTIYIAIGEIIYVEAASVSNYFRLIAGVLILFMGGFELVKFFGKENTERQDGI